MYIPPQNSPQGIIGLKFANLLIQNDFEGAYKLLSANLKAEFTPELLKQNYHSMIEYGESPVNLAQVINILNEWGYPEQKPEDIGWAYVAIVGTGWSEAVSVIVTAEASEHLISHIEWGRP